MLVFQIQNCKSSEKLKERAEMSTKFWTRRARRENSHHLSFYYTNFMNILLPTYKIEARNDFWKLENCP